MRHSIALRFGLTLFLVALSLVLASQAARTGSARQPVNQPPVAGDDSYTLHGGGTVGPMFANDYDPDGDPINLDILTFPTHGTLYGLATQDSKSYSLTDLSYTGTDSFTYRVCDY